MKRALVFAGILSMVLVFGMSLLGCASAPKIGAASQLQKVLNALPSVPVAGKNVKFEFGGDAWISKVDGKEFLSGSGVFKDTADGATITLKQTHIWSDEKNPLTKKTLGWVKTPGPQIVLEYKKGPPESLTAK